MWSDRYTTYYAREVHYAVRWLRRGRPEEEARYEKFVNKTDAERLYNKMVAAEPDYRVELFLSQTKWVLYHANHDEFGDPSPTPYGESGFCLSDAHERCQAGAQHTVCACPCHSDNALTRVAS